MVENSSPEEVSRARWLFPLYLVAINLFVILIALAGLVTFPFGAVDSDMYVLALPIEADSRCSASPSSSAGLSAATAMVIVECVALSIMVSNDIVLPLVLQRGPARLRRQPGFRRLPAQDPALCDLRHHGDGVFLLSRARQRRQLAAIGLLSFAALAQLARRAFFGGLFWREEPPAAP